MDDPNAGRDAPPYLGAGQPPGISERMQALMSRAEQEIAEQRALQSLVADVRQSLAQIQDEIRNVAGAHTLDLLRGEVTGLGAEVRTTTTMLGERLEAVVRAVGGTAQVLQTIGEQLTRITDLLNTQQQQIAGLTSAAVQQREATAALGDGLAERLDAAFGDARSAGSASLDALGDRIESAVLALAEALLRPRLGAAGDQDVPTSATMTVPVVAAPPWAGAATERSEAAPEDEPEDEEPEPENDESEPDAEDEDEDEPTAPAAEAEPEETDTEAAADAAPEPEPEPEQEPEEVDGAPPTAEAPATEDATEDAAEPEGEEAEPDEVPLDAWPDEAPAETAEPAEAAAPTTWGWDAPAAEPAETETDEGQAEKRRPWWRPGG